MADKKYDCRDCFSCQWCSDERCRKCRGSLPSDNKKTAVADNNTLNSSSGDCDCGLYSGPCRCGKKSAAE